MHLSSYKVNHGLTDERLMLTASPKISADACDLLGPWLMQAAELISA